MGLTGLAFVFLIVMVAAAGLRPFHEESAPKAKEETLATLGVAPGADEVKPPAQLPPPQPPAVLNTPPIDQPLPGVEPLIIDSNEKLTQI
jgi:hypothetical protein